MTLKTRPRDSAKISTLWKTYKDYLNLRKIEIHEEAWEKLIQAAVTQDTTLFWKTIDYPFSKDSSAVKIDVLVLPEEWITHFENIFNPKAALINNKEKSNFIIVEPVRLPLITLGEIKAALNKSANGKAAGPDGVPIDVFKHNIDFWSPILLNVFNATLGGTLPASWVESIMVPIFKKGDRGKAKCYCPISLLDSTLNLMGRVLLGRLENWASENNILTEAKYGFRRAIGTVE